MERYTYINAVLDANPTVVKLVLDDRAIVGTGGTIPSDYAEATGPVPVGEQSIPGRVTVEAKSDPLNSFAEGYDSAGVLTIRFSTL